MAVGVGRKEHRWCDIYRKKNKAIIVQPLGHIVLPYFSLTFLTNISTKCYRPFINYKQITINFEPILIYVL